MGGDFGPVETIPAALAIQKQYSDLSLILVGKEDEIEVELTKHKASPCEQLVVQHATEIVEMHESPSLALRNKKDSSMRIAIELVRDGKADACVSAGNTGALMATARFLLKMLPGIDRPAICSVMPGIGKPCHMLDLGANIDSSSEQLFQFAVMGAQLVSELEDNPSPTVALLNVGSEDIKGSDTVKQTAALLSESDLNYVGYAEGTDIYNGKFDVIVCDGFVGNISLKTSEGLANFLKHYATEEFKGSLYGKLAALVALPVLKSLKRKIDPRRYNGASLLGLKGIVVKSHGGADRVSFKTAIEEAIKEVEHNIPEKINNSLEAIFNGRAV